MRQNVNDWERVASIAAAAALIALGSRQPARSRGPVLGAAAGLLARGLTGYCLVNAALGRNSRRSNTKEALGGPRGIYVRESVTIARPVNEVFAFWRNLTNLPRFMRHLESVEVSSPTRSRWTATGPAGTRVSWDAEIINEIPGELIGWRSLENADVASAGSVHFEPSPTGGTKVLVHLQYDPPAGKLGAWVASMMGEEPSQQIREDLRGLKAFLETGETPTVEGQSSGRTRFPAFPTTAGSVSPFRPVDDNRRPEISNVDQLGELV